MGFRPHQHVHFNLLYDPQIQILPEANAARWKQYLPYNVIVSAVMADMLILKN